MTARYTAHENDLLLSAKLSAMPDPLALRALGATPATLQVVKLPASLTQSGNVTTPAYSSLAARHAAALARLAAPGNDLATLVADLQLILEG